MVKTKYTSDNLYWQGYGARGKLHCWWERTLIQPFWKSMLWLLRKLGINLSQDPTIPLLSIYPKDTPLCHNATCSIMFIEALFIVARNWKQPRCPSTEEWIKKMWYIHMIEHHSAVKINDIMEFKGKY